MVASKPAAKSAANKSAAKSTATKPAAKSAAKSASSKGKTAVEMVIPDSHDLEMQIPQLLSQAEYDAIEYNNMVNVPYGMIRPNPNNPRSAFPIESLRELAGSVIEIGLQSPIVLVKREINGQNYFMLVSGERRWRSLGLIKQTQHWSKTFEDGTCFANGIPAVIRNLNDTQVDIHAIVENLQREDVAPLDEARGFQRLISEHGMTYEQVAQSVGIKQPYRVRDRVALLRLDEKTLQELSTGFVPGKKDADGNPVPSNLTWDAACIAARDFEGEERDRYLDLARQGKTASLRQAQAVRDALIEQRKKAAQAQVDQGTLGELDNAVDSVAVEKLTKMKNYITGVSKALTNIIESDDFDSVIGIMTSLEATEMTTQLEMLIKVVNALRKNTSQQASRAVVSEQVSQPAKTASQSAKAAKPSTKKAA